MSDLTALYRRATRLSRNVTGDRREEIDDLWQEVHSGVDTTDETAFGPFLAGEIRDLHRETHPRERREHLCNDQSIRCNVLSGELPVDLQRSRSSLGEAEQPITPADARRYISQHPKCHAVRTALEKWRKKRQATKTILQKICMLASQGSTPALDESNIPH